MKINKELLKGSTTMLILELLQQENMYGYQMIKELSQKSEKIFELKEGTLYPILYRLEDDGLVQSCWSSPEGKQMARKYYQITESGKQALFEIGELWMQMSDGIRQIMEE